MILHTVPPKCWVKSSDLPDLLSNAPPQPCLLEFTQILCSFRNPDQPCRRCGDTRHSQGFSIVPWGGWLLLWTVTCLVLWRRVSGTWIATSFCSQTCVSPTDPEHSSGDKVERHAPPVSQEFSLTDTRLSSSWRAHNRRLDWALSHPLLWPFLRRGPGPVRYQ